MKGFTLIELLVVVIIIGILTAIALPQYELVVEKARASEAMVNAKAIQDACQRHLQEYPEDTCNDKSKIADVQLKGGTWEDNTCFHTKNFNYDISNSSSIYVARVDGASCDTDDEGDTSIYTVVYPKPTSDSEVASPTCTDYSSDGDYAQICKLFTNL